MSLRISFDTSILDALVGVRTNEVNNMMAQSLRENANIITNAWSSRITNTAGPHLRLDGSPRRPYRKALRLKVWKWPAKTGVTAIFGPSGREVPHAHLPERGTVIRTRLPYSPGPRGRGHGVRGRYESVNFRGSRRYGRPPFPAGSPILRTGAVAARRWKEQAAEAAGTHFCHSVSLTFRDLFNEYLANKLVGPKK